MGCLFIWCSAWTPCLTLSDWILMTPSGDQNSWLKGLKVFPKPQTCRVNHINVSGQSRKEANITISLLFWTHLNITIPCHHSNKGAVTSNQSTFMAAGSDSPWDLQNQLQLISGWVITHSVIVTWFAYYYHVISESELSRNYLSSFSTTWAVPQLLELFLNYLSSFSAIWAVPRLSEQVLNYWSCS